LGNSEVATAVEMLLRHRDLTIQDSGTVAAALEHCRRRPALGFSDCLILEVARKAATFLWALSTESLESSMELKNCRKIEQRVETPQRRRQFPAIRTPNSERPHP